MMHTLCLKHAILVFASRRASPGAKPAVSPSGKPVGGANARGARARAVAEGTLSILRRRGAAAGAGKSGAVGAAASTSAAVTAGAGTAGGASGASAAGAPATGPDAKPAVNTGLTQAAPSAPVAAAAQANPLLAEGAAGSRAVNPRGAVAEWFTALAVLLARTQQVRAGNWLASQSVSLQSGGLNVQSLLFFTRSGVLAVGLYNSVPKL